LKKILVNTLDEILNILYPEKNTCMICDYWDKYIGEDYICRECFLKLKELKGHRCRICSKPLVGAGDVCLECIEHKKYFKKIYSPYLYKGELKEVIKDYKYNNKPYFYKMLGHLLLEYIKGIDINIDIITFVPLHKNKKRKRGYNQAELIAKYLGKRLDIPCMKLIERTVDTIPQNKLNNEDRRQNLKNTFKSIEKVKNKKILIVDDVYTTGTTINECSKVLIKAESEIIYGLTITR